jgi:peptidoglycan/LPS O-acetylase OafA/YrhL
VERSSRYIHRNSLPTPALYDHAWRSQSGRHESGSKPFLPALTGVRAFAALWVFSMHMAAVVTAMLPGRVASAWAFVTTPGFLGVDLFFVLSGFIISYNYAAIFDNRFDVTRWGRFLWARLARIYPVHFVLLIALAAAVLGMGFGRVPESPRDAGPLRV